jgi:Abnormal spindle-like microcephaly-assoc'd, ASPM-SPD-2-Hydin/PQQ-like domain
VIELVRKGSSHLFDLANYTRLVKVSKRALLDFGYRNLVLSLIISGLLLVTDLAPITFASGAAGGISGDSSNLSWYGDQTQLTGAALQHNFGERYRTQLDGQIYAQPLDYEGVVLVATEADKVYGISATTGAIVWSDSLNNLNNSNLGTVATPYQGCGDIGTHIGVTSTPVIDRATGILYVMADIAVQGVAQYRLFALNSNDGSVATGWSNLGVQIQGTAINSNPTYPTVFSAPHQTQRTGLVLVNGVVYAGFSAQCDYQPYQGWVAGVNTQTHSLSSLWSAVVADSNGTALNGGGIWQSGGAPVVDANGNLYFATGNVFSMTYPNPESGIGNALTAYSEAVLKLQTTGGQLAATDWFIPTNALNLDRYDLDFASGGPVALPASMSSAQFPNVMLQIGKWGVLDVLNMNNLGGYGTGSGGTDGVLSSVPATGGAWCHPAIWPGDGGYVYVTVTGAPHEQFPTTPGTLDVFKESIDSAGVPHFTLVATTSNTPSGYMKFGSGSPLVTSNGTTNGSGLVWVEQLPDGPQGQATLAAYSAVPTNPGPQGSLNLVWQSPLTFKGEKYAEPGAGDNMIFVGTRDGQLIGYGLNTTPQVTGNGVNFGSVQAGTTVRRLATITATTATTVNSLALSGNAFHVAANSFSAPTILTLGQTLSIPVDFNPTVSGMNSGQLTFNTSHGSITIALLGVEVASSHFALSSPVIDFGVRPIERGTVSLQVSVKNLSSSAVTVLGFDRTTMSSVYTISRIPASKIIRSQQWFTFTLTFHPPGTAGQYAQDFPSLLTLLTSNGNAGIPLFATAAPSSNLALMASSLDFHRVRVGHSTSLSFRLVNNGGLPLTITRASTATAPFSSNVPFRVGTIFPPNANITVTITFQPTRKGVFTRQLVLLGNDGTGVHRLTVTGIGS